MSSLLDVVLFIRKNVNELNLSLVERVVLFSIAGRIGNNEETWITQKALAEECQISPRYLRTIISQLSERKLIKIKKNGRKNHYQLSIENRICSSAIEGVVEEQQRIHRSYDIADRGSVDPINRGSVVPISQEILQLEALEPVSLEENREKVKEKEQINNKAKRQLTCVHFEDFWKVYPRNENKQKAMKIWQRKRLDEKAQILIEDVLNRKERHKAWKDGFIPHATTYLNGERWEDAITEGVSNGNAIKQQGQYVSPRAQSISSYMQRLYADSPQH